MNSSQFAPAATAGGQQNGPVSLHPNLEEDERGKLRREGGARDSISIPVSITTLLTGFCFSQCVKTAAPRQHRYGDEMNQALFSAMHAASSSDSTADRDPYH